MLTPDAVRLRHMREAAASALAMAAGRARSDLDDNLMLRLAVIHCLEILGEAASKVTQETRTRYPLIPFSKIVSMRNRLIHAYFDVDLDIVWTTLADDLPSLLGRIDSALAETAR